MPDAAVGPRGRCVALFRAINVGGHGKVAMADLLAIAAELGLERAGTILQSGNLVFDAPDREAAALERAFETGTARLGLSSDVMVRDAANWAALIADNPFRVEAEDRPAYLAVLVLKDRAAPDAEAKLAQAIKGRERVVVAERAAYVDYPDGPGRSKLTTQILERHLGTRVTGRNWRTAEKIAAALGVRAGLSH